MTIYNVICVICDHIHTSVHCAGVRHINSNGLIFLWDRAWRVCAGKLSEVAVQASSTSSVKQSVFEKSEVSEAKAETEADAEEIGPDDIVQAGKFRPVVCGVTSYT